MKDEVNRKQHVIFGIGMGIFLPLISLYIWPHQISLAVWTGVICTLSIAFGFKLFTFIIGRGYYDLRGALALVAGGIIGILIFLAGYQFFFR